MAKARAYARMRQEGISIEDITLIAGEPYETVKNHLSLNELPEDVQNLIDTGRLGISFGLSLLKLRHKPQQCTSLAQKAAENTWTRQKLEDEISKILASLGKTSDFPELPVTPGKDVFQEKEAIPSFSTETNTTITEEAARATPPPQQPEQTMPQRDSAWDFALRHYPASLVDLVWEKVTVQGRRLPFLRVLLNVAWEHIVKLNMVQEVFQEAKQRFEKPERVSY
jgi:ParB-like chromosome segregation protein Spo0J